MAAALFTAVPVASVGQAVEAPLEITQSGRDYAASIRLRRIDSDVAYFDPTQGAPNLTAREEPPAPPERGEPWTISDIDGPATVITLAIIAAILLVFWRYGGSAGLVLRRDARNARRMAVTANGSGDGADAAHPDFAAIVRNPDRQAALIALAQLLITKAVAANGLLLQRSWTVRDVIRRLPPDGAYLAELRDLVLIGERVHFRDQPVSDAEFNAYSDRAKPVLDMLKS